MTSDNDSDSGDENNLQPIPEEWQHLSTKEIVEEDYEVIPPTATEDDEDDRRSHHDVAAFHPPWLTDHFDSVNASSDDPGWDAHKDAYSSAYDSPMATRIGDERDDDDDAERLRELHEGRHQSDGELSTRQSQWDKKRVPEAICSSLPLSQSEREEVIAVVESLDFSKFGQQKGLERVTLGVVAVVVDERHRQHDNVDGEIVSFTEEYREVRNSLDMSMSDLSTIKEIVREALDEGDITVERGQPRRDTHLPDPTPKQEYPRRYWEELSAESWARHAKNWSEVPDEFKKAIPEEYRALIDSLRNWEPWEDEEDSTDSRRGVASSLEEPTDTDGVDEVLDELETASGEELSDELSNEPTE